MKKIVLFLSAFVLAVSCSTPQEKLEERQAEAREEYDESMKEAQEEYQEDQKDEAEDMVEDSDGVKINKDQNQIQVDD